MGGKGRQRKRRKAAGIGGPAEQPAVPGLIRITDGGFAGRLAAKYAWQPAGRTARAAMVHRMREQAERPEAVSLRLQLMLRQIRLMVPLHLRLEYRPKVVPPDSRHSSDVPRVTAGRRGREEVRPSAAERKRAPAGDARRGGRRRADAAGRPSAAGRTAATGRAAGPMDAAADRRTDAPGTPSVQRADIPVVRSTVHTAEPGRSVHWTDRSVHWTDGGVLDLETGRDWPMMAAYRLLAAAVRQPLSGPGGAPDDWRRHRRPEHAPFLRHLLPHHPPQRRGGAADASAFVRGPSDADDRMQAALRGMPAVLTGRPSRPFRRPPDDADRAAAGTAPVPPAAAAGAERAHAATVLPVVLQAGLAAVRLLIGADQRIGGLASVPSPEARSRRGRTFAGFRTPIVHHAEAVRDDEPGVGLSGRNDQLHRLEQLERLAMSDRQSGHEIALQRSLRERLTLDLGRMIRIVPRLRERPGGSRHAVGRRADGGPSGAAGINAPLIGGSVPGLMRTAGPEFPQRGAAAPSFMHAAAGHAEVRRHHTRTEDRFLAAFRTRSSAVMTEAAPLPGIARTAALTAQRLQHRLRLPQVRQVRQVRHPLGTHRQPVHRDGGAASALLPHADRQDRVQPAGPSAVPALAARAALPRLELLRMLPQMMPDALPASPGGISGQPGGRSLIRDAARLTGRTPVIDRPHARPDGVRRQTVHVRRRAADAPVGSAESGAVPTVSTPATATAISPAAARAAEVPAAGRGAKRLTVRRSEPAGRMTPLSAAPAIHGPRPSAAPAIHQTPPGTATAGRQMLPVPVHAVRRSPFRTAPAAPQAGRHAAPAVRRAVPNIPLTARRGLHALTAPPVPPPAADVPGRAAPDEGGYASSPPHAAAMPHYAELHVASAGRLLASRMESLTRRLTGGDRPAVRRQVSDVPLQVAARPGGRTGPAATVIGELKSAIRGMEQELSRVKADWSKPAIDLNRLADDLYKAVNRRFRHEQQRRGL